MKFIKIVACIAFIFTLYKMPYINEYLNYNSYTNDFSNMEYVIYNSLGLIDKGNKAFFLATICVVSFAYILISFVYEISKKQTSINNQTKENEKSQTPPQE